ncbi:hsp70 nucleotide exchange factor FES1-like [Olea europaea var. sylvestris]|uniref:Hsp70 nucleotide exchange factor FES1-like n=1 Tax=Olea europaea subsp. europaea TaxID=158383 RepID=A0A8S0RYA6_OLEEU|nr:hsp70 nucleotide exchange factor FES1-like [Olea europaea var. sylvestris]CAA2985155.1 hsp70 nucleotide exchange factor FES1-like [Olea europaea subsp. europaea]CAA2985156.1 hsp70 nucleotide exchange factor FES1-like [Olea europaea subsp. europaea]
MAKETPNWEGLLKWSLSHSDGTGSARNLSEEDRRWFMDAMQAQSVDVIRRMKEITLVMQTPEQVLESQGVTPQDIEGMLDELQEHVESIDNANDIHSIGGLVPLLGYLKNSHAIIRAKAAEVVGTIVQNNPKSQQLVMEANGLEPLLSNFTSDSDVTVRTKALGAISSLIRHNRPGIAAFRLANGYAALRDALSSESGRFQRKALNLVHYLLHENHSDCGVVTELGFPRIMMHLASSKDGEVREAALQGLLELTRYRLGKADTSQSEEDDKLKQILQERINGISEMSAEDLGAAREERHLVDSLWSTCYNEPSSLRERGLLALPGEDAPPPDVASKHFEPPLRAWGANRNPDAKSSTKKEEKETPPLLLGPVPSSGNAS